jgi:excinuclease ABC subunit A
VLDEPSIGLHSRDNLRLIDILRQLRDQGNTVLVVEHDADMIRVADHIVDLGLGAGSRAAHHLHAARGRLLRRNRGPHRGSIPRGAADSGALGARAEAGSGSG